MNVDNGNFGQVTEKQHLSKRRRKKAESGTIGGEIAKTGQGAELETKLNVSEPAEDHPFFPTFSPPFNFCTTPEPVAFLSQLHSTPPTLHCSNAIIQADPWYLGTYLHHSDPLIFFQG